MDHVLELDIIEFETHKTIAIKLSDIIYVAYTGNEDNYPIISVATMVGKGAKIFETPHIAEVDMLQEYNRIVGLWERHLKDNK